MPHIIVEYCETLTDLDVPNLVSALHKDLGARESVNPDLISSRAVAVNSGIVGEQQKCDQLVHIVLKLFEGRSEELRAEMSKGLQDIARSIIDSDRVSITVEVVEMNKSTYQMN